MKRRKLYYIPGLISIIGLPLLLIIWGPEDPSTQTCLKLYIPTIGKDTANVEKFTAEGVYRTIKHKKIETVILDDTRLGEIYEDDIFKQKDKYIQNEKLAFIKSEIERFQFTHDTTVALKVQFGKFCSYQDFIWVYNQMLIYNISRYALIENEFYVLSNPAPAIPKHEAVIEPFSNANPFDWPVVQKRAEPTQWELFKTEISYKWENLKWRFEYLFYDQKQNRLLAYGFLLLILIPTILKIRKYSRAGILSYSADKL